MSKFGQPNSVENEGCANGCSSEIYKYSNLGLEVYLDCDAQFVVSGISVRSEQFTLDGFSPISMDESELVQAFQDLVIEVSDGKFTDYTSDEKGLLFFMRDGLVKRIDISPNIDKYMEIINEFEN
ncbi:hypothetical protein ISG33_09270 [Glaciecola sp. MH2013]|uniref:hypothetical protein n=1 Tax=Glaciecola sp. MH2013 TaxID=2785524 RepID=UPI00189E856F|nr:hypothetical protein [Glaciecola sp. MH2013]MBF7073582.1 hypothetical protein [Glaciecola sp. MH2013]